MSSEEILSIGDYLRLTDRASRDDFLAEHPDPVLVSVGESPVVEKSEEACEATISAEAMGEGGLRRSFGSASRDCKVYPIRRKDDKPSLSIGRTPQNDVWIEDRHVSKKHASLRYDHDESGWWLEDHGSTNGTYVNEKRLEAGKPVLLADGDSLHFGRYHKFYFHSADAFHKYLDVLKRFGI